MLLLHRVHTTDCLTIRWELIVEIIDTDVDHFAIIYLVLGSVKFICAQDYLIVLMAKMQAQTLL